KILDLLLFHRCYKQYGLMGLKPRSVYIYKVAKSYGFSFGTRKRKSKTKRFRYVSGGKQTPVCSRTVHS
ncbi:MAG: hypothetical protein ABJL43_08240, partial [Maribacter dokdonensis]|uniref:hypothetical protein n=1 Tax=Maribacter dokdonensis TaxID=320912 RepID=UPI003298263B